MGLCNYHTLCTCAAQVKLPLHMTHGLQDIAQDLHKLQCAPAAVKVRPTHVLCSYGLPVNHTPKLTHLVLQEPARGPSAAELETSKQCILHLKGEATGSQLLGSQAVTDRIRHTADDVTLAITGAMATPVAPEATAADSQSISMLTMATPVISQVAPLADSQATAVNCKATAALSMALAAAPEAFAAHSKATSALAVATAVNPKATAALPTATAADAHSEVVFARKSSAKAAIASAFAQGTLKDINTADATHITLTGADPTATTAEATASPAEHTAAKQLEVQQHQQLNNTQQTSVAARGASTETELHQLRRQLLVSQQSQAAVEARLATCETHNSELQRQLELSQKSLSAAVGTAAALGINVIQLQHQLKAAKAKEAAAEARAAAAEHALLQLKSVGQMFLDLHEVCTSSSLLVDALAHGVAASRCIN